MVHAGAGLARQPRIGGDQVVGLITRHLDTGDTESARRVAHQRKLRHQVFRRRRPVGLVLRIMALRKVFSPASNITARWVGASAFMSSSSFHSMLQ